MSLACGCLGVENFRIFRARPRVLLNTAKVLDRVTKVRYGEAGQSHLTLTLENPREEWRGLRSVAKVTGERHIGEEVSGEEVSIESRYYISSLPGDANQLLWTVRTHWGIENSLHWVLDIALREDESRCARVMGQSPDSLI